MLVLPQMSVLLLCPTSIDVYGLVLEYTIRVHMYSRMRIQCICLVISYLVVSMRVHSQKSSLFDYLLCLQLQLIYGLVSEYTVIYTIIVLHCKEITVNYTVHLRKTQRKSTRKSKYGENRIPVNCDG